MSSPVSFKVFCSRYSLVESEPSSKAEYSTYLGNLELFSKAAVSSGVTSPPVKRVTVSLPPDVVDMLDSLSGLLQLSRSAFLSGFLSESLPMALNMAKAAHGAPEGDSSARSYRASSKGDIDELIKKLTSLGVQDDLFNGK